MQFALEGMDVDKEFLVNNLAIVEWYDGLAFGLISSSEMVFFGMLLAYDPATDRRRYAVVPTLDLQITDVFSRDVEELVREALSCAFDGLLYLSSCNPKSGDVIRLEEASVRERSELITVSYPFIESALTARAKAFWLK